MGGGLWHLALAVAVFLFSHSLTNRPRFRARAEALAGGRVGFTLAYSAVSLLLLAWVIAAYVAAPTLLLWGQEPWMRWVPAAAMLPACLLIAVGMTSPNPFSIGPGRRGFDPIRPGALRLTRHPVLWGLALWAAAHIVPNGDVAALMVFVPLLALALAGPTILDRKRRRSLGEEEWMRLAAFTVEPWSVDLPVLAAEIGWKRPLVGVVLYVVLLALHQPVIGASPLP